MTNIKDQLEQRSERGEVRGADTVWAQANQELRSADTGHHSAARILFAAAAAVAVIAGGAIVVQQANDGNEIASQPASVFDTTMSPDASTADSETPSEATMITLDSTSEPSQSPEDAERDEIVPAVAELPISLRVDAVLSVDAPEGQWVISELKDEVLDLAPGCGLGDPEGVEYRDIICVPEYGEVLLMNEAGDEIIRAFPLPALKPQELMVVDDAVYCSRNGDGALPDSMLCRIDRSTLESIVRVFPTEESAVLRDEGEDIFYPSSWITEEPVAAGTFGRIELTESGPVLERSDGPISVDPLTLEVR